ncbi:hypothetical protein NX059_007600 [Plenodomus lindquistii]|nr:hypothetical protein NX059_007600 [Plenodomus lindquistii]
MSADRFSHAARLEALTNVANSIRADMRANTAEREILQQASVQLFKAVQADTDSHMLIHRRQEGMEKALQLILRSPASHGVRRATDEPEPSSVPPSVRDQESGGVALPFDPPSRFHSGPGWCNTQAIGQSTPSFDASIAAQSASLMGQAETTATSDHGNVQLLPVGKRIHLDRAHQA